MLWGPPGVGKSQITAQFCAEEQIGFVDLRLSQLDPAELRGLPYVRDGVSSWARPTFFPDADQHGPRGILFLDEITSAAPSSQAAAYQLIQDRRLGDHILPPGWLPMGASNRDCDRGVIYTMPAPLANRFTHLFVEPCLDSFTGWALVNEINPIIIAFLNFRSELLFQFSPNAESPAFPTPRAWHRVSLILARPSPAEHDLIAGTIGEGAAGEFIAFARTWRSLPDIELLLTNPGSAPIPGEESLDQLYGVIAELAARASAETIGAISMIADRIPGEYGVALMDWASRREPSIVSSAEFIGWAKNHTDFILGE